MYTRLLPMYYLGGDMVKSFVRVRQLPTDWVNQSTINSCLSCQMRPDGTYFLYGDGWTIDPDTIIDADTEYVNGMRRTVPHPNLMNCRCTYVGVDPGQPDGDESVTVVVRKIEKVLGVEMLPNQMEEIIGLLRNRTFVVPAADLLLRRDAIFDLKAMRDVYDGPGPRVDLSISTGLLTDEEVSSLVTKEPEADEPVIARGKE